MNALMPREMPFIGALIGKFTGEASQERQQLLYWLHFVNHSGIERTQWEIEHWLASDVTLLEKCRCVGIVQHVRRDDQ